MMWDGVPLWVIVTLVVAMGILSTLCAIKAYKKELDGETMAILAWIGMMVILNGLANIFLAIVFLIIGGR